MKKDHLNHTPNGGDIAKIEQLRRVIIAVDEEIDNLCPDSREKSLAKTKLEECRMWAVKSVAMQGTPLPVD